MRGEEATVAPETTSRPGAGGLLLARLDAILDRLYTSRANPLLQSGTIAVALLLVLIATGLYLLLFYRIGDPHGSTARIAGQTWTGSWIRSLHRFASDAALVAIAVHALRMFLRRRTWGARALAWLSGLVLVGLFALLGLTGYVMIWDVQGQMLAEEGARFLDALPIFAEPVGRTFLGERPMPGAFFFLNYFLHIAVPLGVGVLLYLHVSRLARPTLLPPPELGWSLVALLTLLAIVWPAPLGPKADPARLVASAPLDWFFGFWLPVTRQMQAWSVWAVGGALAVVGFTVPLWTRPRGEKAPAPSWVDPSLCTGCEQCVADCPYEAIVMVQRPAGGASSEAGPRAAGSARSPLVARVDPSACVSCGICAGSCAPMGVGPPGRTGRDQLQRVRDFLAARRPGPREVVLAACSFGAGDLGGMPRFGGARVYPVACVGSLHTSVVELLLRGGAAGVMVAGCPARDCWNREGPGLTERRLFHGREAELQARVDRRRVRYVRAGAAGRPEILARLRQFRAELARLEPGPDAGDLTLDFACDPPPGSEGVARTAGANS